MQIQSKHVAKPEDVKRIEELAKKTSRTDKYHWIAIAIVGVLTLVNTYKVFF